jgi:hypothetical protein
MCTSKRRTASPPVAEDGTDSNSRYEQEIDDRSSLLQVYQNGKTCVSPNRVDTINCMIVQDITAFCVFMHVDFYCSQVPHESIRNLEFVGRSVITLFSSRDEGEFVMNSPRESRYRFRYC